MKSIPVLAVAALLLTFITGCSKQTYTADYLLKDVAKRKEILADCKDNKQSTENCNNANQAQAAINSQIFAKQAHLQLLQAKIQNIADGQRMFGADSKSQNEIKALQDEMQKTKAEIEALAKQ